VVSMNLLRAGLDVAQDREGGLARLAGTFRSLALLSLAIGVVVAIRAGRGGAGRALAAIGGAAVAAAGAMAAARALTRSDRGDAERGRGNSRFY